LFSLLIIKFLCFSFSLLYLLPVFIHPFHLPLSSFLPSLPSFWRWSSLSSY
jgi:hypothetical protein